MFVALLVRQSQKSQHIVIDCPKVTKFASQSNFCVVPVAVPPLGVIVDVAFAAAAVAAPNVIVTTTVQ